MTAPIYHLGGRSLSQLDEARFASEPGSASHGGDGLNARPADWRWLCPPGLLPTIHQLNEERN
jgi:hypothetical protein